MTTKDKKDVLKELGNLLEKEEHYKLYGELKSAARTDDVLLWRAKDLLPPLERIVYGLCYDAVFGRRSVRYENLHCIVAVLYEDQVVEAGKELGISTIECMKKIEAYFTGEKFKVEEYLGEKEPMKRIVFSKEV